MSELSRQQPLDWQRVRRVLVMRPRYLGDVCITLPLLDHLGHYAPHASIDYLVEEPYAPLLEGDPRLEQIVGVERSNSVVYAARLMARLAARRYDLVLDLFCNPRTAAWTAATRAPVRVGYPGKGWRSWCYNRFSHPREKGAVAFHLASIAALGWPVDHDVVPQLHITREGHARAAARLEQLGITREHRLIILHTGARWPTRRWASEDFAALAKLSIREFPDCRILLLAGPGEEDRCRDIAERVAHEHCRVMSDVPLGELPGLFAAATGFVGGDSGPVHVSVAAGTPTVGIYGRNRPEIFFPYPARFGHRAAYTDVWCSPCDLDVCSHMSCLRSLSPDIVWNGLRELLEREIPWPTPTGAITVPA